MQSLRMKLSEGNSAAKTRFPADRNMGAYAELAVRGVQLCQDPLRPGK
jgi:hypothetical protein